MHRTRRRLLLATVVVSACTGAADRGEDREPAPPRKVHLIRFGDSVPYRNDLQDGVLRRVVVGTQDDAPLDTIRDVLTGQLPIAHGDTSVVGFRYDEDRVLGLFHYTPRTGRLRTQALPLDFVPFSTPSLSPDGRHVAYLGRDSTGRGYGVVIAWETDSVRYRGAPVVLPGTDAGVDDFGWNHATRFTLHIGLEAPFGATQRTMGEIDVLGNVSVQVDTIRLPPRAA